MMKKIILIIILLFIISGASLLSSSSLVKIPIFSDIFYREKIADLGIETAPETIKSLSQKLGFTPQGQSIGTILPEPKTIRATEIEVTSWVNKLCEEFPHHFPLKNFQIKFEKGKFKSSAHIFKPITADITVFGSVSKRDEVSIDLEFEKVYIGNLPAPGNIVEKLKTFAEKEINEEILKGIGGLRIDELEILDGEILFVGMFPYLPIGEDKGEDDYHIMW